MPREFIHVTGSDRITPVKIGRSNDPAKRLTKLQTGCPVPLRVFWQCPGEQVLEAALHKEFKPYQTWGEWFDFGDEDPVTKVAEAVARLDPTLNDARKMQRARAAARWARYEEKLGSRRRIMSLPSAT